MSGREELRPAQQRIVGRGQMRVRSLVGGDWAQSTLVVDGVAVGKTRTRFGKRVFMSESLNASGLAAKIALPYSSTEMPAGFSRSAMIQRESPWRVT